MTRGHSKGPGCVGAFTALLRVGVLAALIAVIFFATRRPDFDESAVRIASVPESTLREILISSRDDDSFTGTVEIPWDIINGVLAEKVRQSTTEGWRVLPLENSRCFVLPEDGVCTLVLERDLFGFSLFTTLQIRAAHDGHRPALVIEAAHLGKLPVPPAVALYSTPALASLDTAFEAEIQALQSARDVKISPAALEIVPGSG